MGLAEAVFITGFIVTVLAIGTWVPLLIVTIVYQYAKGKTIALCQRLIDIFLSGFFYGILIGLPLVLIGSYLHITQ